MNADSKSTPSQIIDKQTELESLLQRASYNLDGFRKNNFQQYNAQLGDLRAELFDILRKFNVEGAIMGRIDLHDPKSMAQIIQNIENHKDHVIDRKQFRSKVEKFFSINCLRNQAQTLNKLSTFIGQSKIIEKLKFLIEKTQASKKRFPHLLFIGEEGNGKSAIAHSMACELNVNIKTVQAQEIVKEGNIAGVLTTLEEGSILLVEDIHKLSKTMQEYLCCAAEEYALEIVIDTGREGRKVKLNLPEFTIIGTTSNEAELSKRLWNTFLCAYRLEAYQDNELIKIFERELDSMEIKFDERSLSIITQKSHKNPEEGIRLLQKVARYLSLTGSNELTESLVNECLQTIEHNTIHSPINYQDRLIAEIVKREVWRRDNGKCVQCGSNERLEFDHIIPASKGGSNTTRNIQLLCEPCNREKSDNI